LSGLCIILLRKDDGNFLERVRAYFDSCAGNCIFFDLLESGQPPVGVAGTVTTPGEVYLRVVRQSTVYTGYVSGNGTDWDLVGVLTVTGGLVPSKVGMMASNINPAVSEIPADFDYFMSSDNAYRTYRDLRKETMNTQSVISKRGDS